MHFPSEIERQKGAQASHTDVIVVGAGPAGSTAAYYLAKPTAPGRGKRVALLEKATFPRDKTCGDAWCAPALDLLEDMGVLQRLEAEGLVRDTTSGGFVSPSGESYIAAGEGGSAPGTRCYAIKRIICDERIARRAVEVGADLHENAVVAAARLEDDGLWTVRCEDGRCFRSRMLVAADGAASRLARSLGVVTTPPRGVASRQYVRGGTHNFKSGGVLFYPKYILPGYVALFRHYNDDIDLGCYVIPGGAVDADRLLELYENEIKQDPFIQRVLGPKVEFMERPRVASLRLGGVEKSSARQFMAVGDAAGQTDPLTGEGIHTGMLGGKLAAETIHELFARGDFSEQACAVYHRRWMKAFGRDFAASAAGARMVRRFPLFMDAANLVAQRKGEAFMAEFGAAMTGVKPKTIFLRPSVAVPLGIEVARQILERGIARSGAADEQAYAARAREETTRETAFRNGCLIDPGVGFAPPRIDVEQDGPLEEMFRHAGDDPAARRVVVLYGTEYGFARQIAHALCAALAAVKVGGEGPPLSPRCLSMSQHELVEWGETRVCLLICATAGDGVPPVAARPFFDLLGSPSLELSGLQHATLALGDRAYPHFCRAGRILDSGFCERGARPLLARVDIDGEDESAVATWIGDVCAKLADPATWRSVASDPPEDALRARARRHFVSSDEPADRPSRDAPLLARVLSKRPLTRIVEASDPEVIHLELDVSDASRAGAPALRWEPGDALGVLADNCPDEVAAVLAALGRSGDEAVDLPRRGLRTSLRDALTRHLDIKHVSPVLMETLVDAAKTPAEQERVAGLSRASAAAYRRERELQDVLRDFPAAASSLEPETLAALLGVIRPRYYSISSSACRAAERLSITVAVVRYRSLGRTRTGLATTYLADRVREGDRVPVFVQSNPELRLPAAEAPRTCVMIASGSGVAPFRAFLQELSGRARSAAAAGRAPTSTGAPHLLFYAGRHEERDFLYRDEWRALESEGILQLFSAFSGEDSVERQLPHRLLEHASMLWERMASGQHFYVCGDATRMAGAVERAMLEIIQTQGGRSPQQAAAFLAEMLREARLQKDVWPT